MGGILVETNGTTIMVCSSQEKWDKAKRFLSEIRAEVEQTGDLGHKGLEQKRGFFVHLQCIYPAIAPYLKGVHLTLDSWRPDRDSDGWADPDWIDDETKISTESSQAPQRVTPVTRFAEDLQSLGDLFGPDHPPKRLVRTNKYTTCIYGFADASGSGFGSTFALPNSEVMYCYGVWGRDADHVSSNYRELRNVVEALEEAYHDGHLHNCEVFLFTDNSTAEGAYYHGNSPSRSLFELVLRLRRLEMHSNLILHVTHVAGTRMMSQGTDGLLRGLFTSGVLVHHNMLSFIPLHQTALDCCSTLMPWVASWWPVASLTPLTPTDWYECSHGLRGGRRNADGIWMPEEKDESWFLWSPVPAAAFTALQELGVSRHKRPNLGHVFLCPCLFTQHWRKRLHNIADIVLELPADFTLCSCSSLAT